MMVYLIGKQRVIKRLFKKKIRNKPELPKLKNEVFNLGSFRIKPNSKRVRLTSKIYLPIKTK